MTELPSEILFQPTVQPKGAETRMKDARGCRQLVQQLIVEDQPRGWRRAVTKGCYDGNPPMSKVPPGYSWTCNLNFGEMEGLLDSARIPYYAIFSGVKTYTSFTTGFRRSDPESQRWNDIVAEEWTELLNRWKPFRWHMRANEFEMLFEGWGPWMFESPTDWRFLSIPARCIKVPMGSNSVVDERLPYVIVLRDFRIHELWEKIANPEAATAAGWNVEQAKWAIMHAGNRRQTAGQWDWEYWQQKLKNGDLYTSFSECDIVRCAVVFVKEYGTATRKGRISQFILTVDDVGRPDQKSSQIEAAQPYLFSQPNQYATYDEALIVCFQNTGDGTWHSVRGLAMKSFKHIEVSNRLKCQMVNGAFLASTPIISPGKNATKDDLQMMVLGPVAVLREGATINQTRIAQDINGPLAVDRVLTNHLAQNIGSYNQRNISRDDGRGEQPTATAVELQAGKETALSQAQIDSRYDDLDTLYQQMFERARKGPDEESRRFLRNCEERGVPQQAIADMACIRANRLAGYPSPDARKRNFREGYSLFPSLPEQGKRNMINEGLSIYFGPDKVDIFNPPMQKPDMDAWAANMENPAMEAGDQPLVISGMNPVVHLQIHLAYAAEKLQPLHDAMEQEGSIDPAELEKAYRYVAILGPHCEEHLAQIENDPAEKANAQLFSTTLKNLVAFHGKLRGAILDARRQAQQAAMEQQQATALGIMDQAKLQSTQAEIERNNAKAAADIQRKNVKTTHDLALKTFKTGAETKLKAATTASDIQIKKASVAAQPKKKAA